MSELFCREQKITYQGFSLLTANVEVLAICIGRLAADQKASRRK